MFTSGDIKAEERQEEIRRFVNRAGRISVDELSQQLNIPVDIINSDLKALTEKRKIVLTYNGAASLTVGMHDVSVALRTQRQSEEKAQIGEFCTGMIQNDDTIFLDSSTTALAIASHLENRSNLTIISNCLRLIQQLPHKSDWNVLVPAGIYQWETDSLVRLVDIQSYGKLPIKKGFFGAHGISLSEGLTDVSEEESKVKQLLVGLCRQVIVAIDSTKWDRVGRYPFAQLDHVNLIVTDFEAPVDSIEKVRAKGIEVKQV